MTSNDALFRSLPLEFQRGITAAKRQGKGIHVIMSEVTDDDFSVLLGKAVSKLLPDWPMPIIAACQDGTLYYLVRDCGEYYSILAKVTTSLSSQPAVLSREVVAVVKAEAAALAADFSADAS